MNPVHVKGVDLVSDFQHPSAVGETTEAPKKAYRPLAENIPAEAVVVHSNHWKFLSVTNPKKEMFVLLNAKNGHIVVVKDIDKGLAFISTIKMLPTKVYIAIPKVLWPYYERGEKVQILLTILPEVKNTYTPPKPVVIKS